MRIVSTRGTIEVCESSHYRTDNSAFTSLGPFYGAIAVPLSRVVIVVVVVGVCVVVDIDAQAACDSGDSSDTW